MTPLWEIERDLRKVGDSIPAILKENDVDADLRKDLEWLQTRINDLAWKMFCNQRDAKVKS
jgi:hypothetical protein